jgi:hypothetical protein
MRAPSTTLPLTSTQIPLITTPLPTTKQNQVLPTCVKCHCTRPVHMRVTCIVQVIVSHRLLFGLDFAITSHIFELLFTVRHSKGKAHDIVNNTQRNTHTQKGPTEKERDKKRDFSRSARSIARRMSSCMAAYSASTCSSFTRRAAGVVWGVLSSQSAGKTIPRISSI